ncbi:MAG: hypothetical protein MUF49_13240 [Oculatellaceae cyanobacterium Prado106]|nr:hypothetical protein [Oculatellaceae cyanobacterium Prado106]
MQTGLVRGAALAAIAIAGTTMLATAAIAKPCITSGWNGVEGSSSTPSTGTLETQMGAGADRFVSESAPTQAATGTTANLVSSLDFNKLALAGGAIAIVGGLFAGKLLKSRLGSQTGSEATEVAEVSGVKAELQPEAMTAASPFAVDSFAIEVPPAVLANLKPSEAVDAIAPDLAAK